MSILSLIQSAAALVNVGVPALVVGNADPLVVQLLALAVEEQDELMSQHEWSALTVTATPATTSGPLFSVPFPADYDRMVVGAVVYNATRVTRLEGPTSPEDWQEITVRNVSLYPQRWRLKGGALQIWGAAPGETLSYEYISNAYVKSSLGTTKGTFTSDTDTLILPERLVKLGLVWRWKRAKGLDYAEDLNTYERQKERLLGADRGYRRIGTARPLFGSMASGIWNGTIGL